MVPKAPYSSNPNKAKRAVYLGHWFMSEWFYVRMSVSLETGYQLLYSLTSWFSGCFFMKSSYFFLVPFTLMQGHWSLFASWSSKHLFESVWMVACAMLDTRQHLHTKPVAEGKVSSSGFSRHFGHFEGGRDVLYLCISGLGEGCRLEFN